MTDLFDVLTPLLLALLAVTNILLVSAFYSLSKKIAMNNSSVTLAVEKAPEKWMLEKYLDQFPKPPPEANPATPVAAPITTAIAPVSTTTTETKPFTMEELINA